MHVCFGLHSGPQRLLKTQRKLSIHSHPLPHPQGIQPPRSTHTDHTRPPPSRHTPTTPSAPAFKPPPTRPSTAGDRPRRHRAPTGQPQDGRCHPPHGGGSGGQVAPHHLDDCGGGGGGGGGSRHPPVAANKHRAAARVGGARRKTDFLENEVDEVEHVHEEERNCGAMEGKSEREAADNEKHPSGARSRGAQAAYVARAKGLVSLHPQQSSRSPSLWLAADTTVS